MELFEAIRERRSVRKYKNDPVPEETVRELLEAAMCAPSAGGGRPWHFIVITNKEVLEKVTTLHPHANMVLQAPVAILICGEEKLEKYPGRLPLDCAAATENLLLAVQAKELGAVWVGIYPVEERMEGMRRLLGIPEGVVPFSLVPIGVPAEKKPQGNRFDPQKVHREKW